MLLEVNTKSVCLQSRFAVEWVLNKRFHGRGCHLVVGPNVAKFTVNVWENRDFDAR